MNKFAQALARMRRGIKERPSAGKRRAAKRNLANARQKRWPKPDARTPNDQAQRRERAAAEVRTNPKP